MIYLLYRVNVDNFSTFLFAKCLKSVAKLSKLGVCLSPNGVTWLHHGTVTCWLWSVLTTMFRVPTEMTEAHFRTFSVLLSTTNHQNHDLFQCRLLACLRQQKTTDSKLPVPIKYAKTMLKFLNFTHTEFHDFSGREKTVWCTARCKQMVQNAFIHCYYSLKNEYFDVCQIATFILFYLFINPHQRSENKNI